MNSVIATTPQGMIAAQSTMLDWVQQRLVEAKRELSSAEETFNALQRAKMRTQPASSQIRRARTQITFYEKIKAALDAGYYIIPPFGVQVFAIRTDRRAIEHCSADRNGRDESGRVLPVGAGDYVDPVPGREFSHAEERGSDGNKRSVDLYVNGDWKDVELPIRAHKPELIEATAKALGLKIFDALGIAPAYRSADPIIVGQIRKPFSYSAPLTFFVAWWLDESDI